MPNQPYKFFVSPSPTSISDIIMNKQKVEYWIDGPVKCTPEIFNLSSNFIFARDRIKDTQFNQNNFFIPFVSANEGHVPSVVVGDIPQFKFYEHLAKTTPLQVLKDAFQDFLTHGAGKIRGDREFDFEQKYHSAFLPSRMKYMAEVIRQSLLFTDKTLVVMDRNHIDFLADEWKVGAKIEKNKIVPQDLSKFYEFEPGKESNEVSAFIERLVYVDFLYDNPITHYFIKFKKFPYQLKGSVTAQYLKDTENLLILWYYYYDKLQKKYNDSKTPTNSSPGFQNMSTPI